MPRFKYWLNGEAIDRESLAKLVRPLPILSFAESFQRQPSQMEVCPFCKTTAESVKESALVGCPLCYAVFEDLLKAQKNLG